MNSGKYVFAQLIKFFPQKAFQRIVMRYQGDKYIKSLSCWNQLLIMMFGQLAGCDSLRELVCIIAAHEPKSYHLGFGKTVLLAAIFPRPTQTEITRSLKSFPTR